MNKEEKIYMFNEYVLGYDKGNNDRSCLTISKIISGDMYVIGSLYDGSAEIISLMLDNLQQENKQLKEEYENIINRYKFIRNRINQGMSIENKNKCLIELGNNILQEIDKLGDSNGNN